MVKNILLWWLTIIQKDSVEFHIKIPKQKKISRE